MRIKYILVLIFISSFFFVSCDIRDKVGVEPVVTDIETNQKTNQQIVVNYSKSNKSVSEEVIGDIGFDVMERENINQNMSFNESASNDTTKEQINKSINTTKLKAEYQKITIKNLYFEPAEVTIKVNTSVVWVHEDDYGGLDNIKHKITIYNVGTSQILQYGDTYEHTFSKAGTYVYVDSIHKEAKGKIIVEE